MKYALVATTTHLLLLDLDSKLARPLESGRPEYYGISWFGDDPDLILTHSGLDNAQLVDVQSYANSETGWVSKAQVRSRPFLSAPHQICCAPDGRIICTNTGRNVVSVIDLNERSYYLEAGISDARWDRLSKGEVTGDHLNSVYLKSDRLYVVAHRHSRGAKLAVFSYPELELLDVKPLGERTGLHNIWITDEGQYISCHSEQGSVVDLDSDQPLWQSGAPIYTRGLAATGDHLLIGESQKTGRELRRSSLTGVWVLDRHTWQELDYICLGPYGAVNEIRILDVPDLAHTGRPFAGLESLLSGPGMLDDIARSRLSGARLARQASAVWKRFTLIYGSPTDDEDGRKCAVENNLCLITRKQNDGNLEFNYTLHPDLDSHVSAVLGYDGAGGDCNMSALLLRPLEDAAVLELWVSDERGWGVMPGVFEAGLPLSGSFSVRTTETAVHVEIDGRKIIELDVNAHGLQRHQSAMGIRWIGSEISID